MVSPFWSTHNAAAHAPEGIVCDCGGTVIGVSDRHRTSGVIVGIAGSEFGTCIKDWVANNDPSHHHPAQLPPLRHHLQ